VVSDRWQAWSPYRWARVFLMQAADHPPRCTSTAGTHLTPVSWQPCRWPCVSDKSADALDADLGGVRWISPPVRLPMALRSVVLATKNRLSGRFEGEDDGELRYCAGPAWPCGKYRSGKSRASYGGTSCPSRTCLGIGSRTHHTSSDNDPGNRSTRIIRAGLENPSVGYPSIHSGTIQRWPSMRMVSSLKMPSPATMTIVVPSSAFIVLA